MLSLLTPCNPKKKIQKSLSTDHFLPSFSLSHQDEGERAKEPMSNIIQGHNF